MGDVLSAVAPIASIAGSLFGGSGDSGGAAPTPSTQQSSNVSGFGALPPQLQQAYLSYGNDLSNLFTNQPVADQTFANTNPSSPYQSQALAQKQLMHPNSPIQSVGQVEPLNSYQINALNQFANPNYSMNNLSQYSNPFQQMVQNTTTNQINRQGQMNQAQIMDQAAQYGGKYVPESSALGTELAQNNNNTMLANANATANLGYQGYNSTLGLQQQSLSNMLNAGNQIQAQNQALVNASMPQNLFSTSTLASMLSAYAPFFNAYPTGSQGSSSGTGAFAGYPSTLQRLGALGTSLTGGSQGLTNAFSSLGNLFSPGSVDGNVDNLPLTSDSGAFNLL